MEVERLYFERASRIVLSQEKSITRQRNTTVNSGTMWGIEKMLRAKPKKKKQQAPQIKVPTQFIMDVLMPCLVLACKDEFKITDQDALDRATKRARRYIGYIADGSVSVGELHSLMECKDPEEELIRRHNAKAIELETRNKQML